MKVTPRHNKFLDKIIDSEIFVIATVRGKDEYVLEEVNGKQVPRKVALGYDQRKDTEYLFTCSFNIEQDSHIATSVKDNTHIFESRNDVLTEKDGLKVFEWATDGDLEEKTKEIEGSIAEGKRLQKLNEEKEAEELAKANKGKAIKQPKAQEGSKPKPQTKTEPESESESPKDLVGEIRKEFTRIAKAKTLSQTEILSVMEENGTSKPTIKTPVKTLKDILKALQEL